MRIIAPMTGWCKLYQLDTDIHGENINRYVDLEGNKKIRVNLAPVKPLQFNKFGGYFSCYL